MCRDSKSLEAESTDSIKIIMLIGPRWARGNFFDFWILCYCIEANKYAMRQDLAGMPTLIVNNHSLPFYLQMFRRFPLSAIWAN